MRTSRLFTVGALFASFAWVLAGGCSSANPDSLSGPNGSNATGGSGGSQGDPTKVTPDPSGTDGGLLTNLNPLCGVGTAAGTCMPDEASACAGYVPPVPDASGAGGVASSGAAGAGGAKAGEGGTPGDPLGQGGVSHEAGATGEGGAGNPSTGAGGAGAGAGAGGEGPGEPAAYGCQVTRQGSQLQRQCVRAGAGEVNAPCFGASDCSAGFACVTDGDAGRCLPYCCDQDTICTSNTYCAERPLRKAASDTSNAEPPQVPVCVPADACSLEEPFPCPSGTDCRCKGDTACMIVRNDGTTTCVKPGLGQQGEACPCAWNHVCSSVTHQCVKICRTDPSKNDCGAQKCQASSELPPNFGVCVGPLK